MNYRLPKRVHQRASKRGEVGKSWIANLDSIVTELAEQWQLNLLDFSNRGEVLEGGSESLVLKTTTSDSTKVILKIGLPSDCDCANEANVYRLADGYGYPKLFKHSDEHNAILIEELGKPLAESQLSYKEQISLVCTTLKEAWISLDNSNGLTTGEEKAISLSKFIESSWQAFQAFCSDSTLSLAMDYAEERKAAYNPNKCVLVHGDAHPFNTLKAEAHTQSYKFVDPDGLFAEAEFDLAIPMREGNAELLARDTLKLAQKRCELLASLTDTNPEAIWQWGFMERVSTGLLLMQLGFDDEGQETLEVANRLSSAL